jgi:hypothetical protein
MTGPNIKLDVLEWIATGVFSGVFIGMSKSEVSSIIGAPLGWAESTTTDEIEDFFDADIWGYGIWTFYFSGDVLDAVTGAFDRLPDVGFHFQSSGLQLSSDDDFDQVVCKLESRNVKFFELPKKYRVSDSSKGEIIDKTRMRANRTLLVGNELLGRITFDLDTESLSQMAYPFSVALQAVGQEALMRRPGVTLITDRD